MATQQVALNMQRVQLEQKSLTEYARVVGDDVIDEIETLARPLHGARVLHVSATAQGGGVAEMIQALVPLMRSAGLDADWRVVAGSEAFFNMTKAMHNALQGMPLDLTADMKTVYLKVNNANATSFTGGFDFVVVHDPQPAPLRVALPHVRGTWIWRCHIDLTAANPEFWDFLRPFIQAYEAAIFTMPDFVMPDLHVGTIGIIPPAIDPLSAKNMRMTDDDIIHAVGRRHVDPYRPMLVQVSRFDPWKDPIGVIDVYRAARLDIPHLQLVLLGAMAHDDPEGEEYYRRAVKHAGNDPDIHILLNAHGSSEVNAFQRRADVILQKSLREGFGLTVTEGLWKARPVVASNVGGIPMQIEDGVSGYLVGSVDQCVERVLNVFRAPEAAVEMGARGRERVRRQFLSTANLANYLRLFNQFAFELPA